MRAGIADEVTVLIDFENLRYGLLNNHGIAPDVLALVERAKKYGRPTIMRAYADFSEHPEEIKRQLQIAGIEAIDIPVKKTTYTKAGRDIERIKNAADMVLALDAVIQALDADSNGIKKVFFLVTGDRDYIKLVTHLRNRFGQRVIVCGVPGSIAGDLVSAAGEQDHIEIPKRDPVDPHLLKTAICAMIRRGPAPLTYWSLRLIDQWSQDVRQNIPGTAKERRDAINSLVDECVLTKQQFTDPRGKTVMKAIFDEALASSKGYL
jgi:uncharacterized LabA/DUF88 family protein